MTAEQILDACRMKNGERPQLENVIDVHGTRYATDGVICCRVGPGGQGKQSETVPGSAEALAKSIDFVLDNVPGVNVERLQVDAIEFRKEPCQHCEGEGQAWCLICEEEHACGCCNGTGRREVSRVFVGQVPFARIQVRRLQSFGGVWLQGSNLVSLRANAQGWDCVSDDGLTIIGALMPMKVA